MFFTKDTNIYVFVGGAGNNANITTTTRYGGWNGGGGINTNGAGFIYSCMTSSGTGGGATDIRSIDGTVTKETTNYSQRTDISSLRSRIMVAGAGGAGGWTTDKDGDVSGKEYSGEGGIAGGLEGGKGYELNTSYNSNGGTQTAGGSPNCNPSQWYSYTYGGFGYGGAGGHCPWGGGGGGWYGGSSGSWYNGGGAGGSSYISGMSGSIAVTSAGAAKCSAGSVSVSCSESWTGYKIVAGTALMIDGAGHKWPEGSSSAESGYTQMPNPSGGYYANGVGHSGHGYARITYLGTTTI